MTKGVKDCKGEEPFREEMARALGWVLLLRSQGAGELVHLWELECHLSYAKAKKCRICS